MREGDIILAPLPQADGKVKNRPVLLLRQLLQFGDFLVCGISTQTRQSVPDFDEAITHGNPDFRGSGLVADSVIRLGFLFSLPRTKMLGVIGAISAERHARLLRRLSAYLTERIATIPR